MLRSAAQRLTRPNTARAITTSTPKPADPKTIQWSSIGFGYVPTRSIALAEFDGVSWGPVETQTDPNLSIHCLSNVIHYGQTLFEGLKAFTHKNGRVMAFRPDDNCARMNHGAERLGMPAVPLDLFNQVLARVINDNADYVPPYGSGGSMYLRPFFFGHGPQLGLGKAKRYVLGCAATPVGNYYPSGIKPAKSIVMGGFDRASPLGVGDCKTAGNYAADVRPSSMASARGFTVVLYLDAKEHKYVEEFSTSNFVAITGDGKSFVTPDSRSILGSITRFSLETLAEDQGLKVERRKIDFNEVASFREVAACGTAVVIVPIESITDERVQGRSKTITIGDGRSFPVMMSLYNRVTAIQRGDEPDKFNWLRYICDRPASA